MGVGEDPPQVTLNGKSLESVERFTYIGSKISSTGGIEKIKLSGRIDKGTRFFE